MKKPRCPGCRHAAHEGECTAMRSCGPSGNFPCYCDHRSTKEEIKTLQIRLMLEELERRWPKHLWLYAASGTLHLMQARADGQFPAKDNKPGMDGKFHGNSNCGADPEASIETFGGIKCDGGDW